MPKFETPGPITVTLDRILGDVHIVAADRTETKVEVRPSDPSKPADVRGAAKTFVDLSSGRLVVKGPKQPNFLGRSETVDVLIELPAGSRVEAQLTMGNFTAQGTLGDIRLKTAMGEMRLGTTGDLTVHGSYGPLAVEHIAGDADISTGGVIRIGRISGKAKIRNSNGSTAVGRSARELLVKAACGDIDIDRLDGNLTARTAFGAIRVDDLGGGIAVLETGAGEIRVAIRPGVPAYLDVSTSFGDIVNNLEPTTGPAESEPGARVTARTPCGDIVIGRSTGIKEAV